MAFVTICDKCMKVLDKEPEDITIKYSFLRRPDSMIKSSKTIHLCGDCFREIYGGSQLDEWKKEEIQ